LWGLSTRQQILFLLYTLHVSVILTIPMHLNTSLISNFHCVINVVFFLLGDSPASELYVPMFWNTLSVPSSYVM